jgi:hypothetical protein
MLRAILKLRTRAQLTSRLSAHRRHLPEVHPLEGRCLLSVTGLTAEASPTILVHPSAMNQPHGLRDQRIVPVTIAGVVANSRSQLPTIEFQVIDPYGRHQPSGTITPGQLIAPGTHLYFTRIGLELSRNLASLQDRHYTIVVTARDQDNALTATAFVTVPRTRLQPGALTHRLLFRVR